MNTDIMKLLSHIKKELDSKESLSPDTIDSIIGELEMIKMNIEQHITNMPNNQDYHNIFSAAHNAVQNITEILEMLEEPIDSEQQNTLTEDILALLDEIIY